MKKIKIGDFLHRIKRLINLNQHKEEELHTSAELLNMPHQPFSKNDELLNQLELEIN